MVWRDSRAVSLSWGLDHDEMGWSRIGPGGYGPRRRVLDRGVQRKDRADGSVHGEKGIVLGVANDYSIAWAISKQLLDEGAEIGYTHLPGEKMERRVRKVDPTGTKFVRPCDVQNDEDMARVFPEAGEVYGRSTSSSTRSRTPRSTTSSGRS